MLWRYPAAGAWQSSNKTTFHTPAQQQEAEGRRGAHQATPASIDGHNGPVSALWSPLTDAITTLPRAMSCDWMDSACVVSLASLKIRFASTDSITSHARLARSLCWLTLLLGHDELSTIHVVYQHPACQASVSHLKPDQPYFSDTPQTQQSADAAVFRHVQQPRGAHIGRANSTSRQRMETGAHCLPLFLKSAVWSSACFMGASHRRESAKSVLAPAQSTLRKTASRPNLVLVSLEPHIEMARYQQTLHHFVVTPTQSEQFAPPRLRALLLLPHGYHLDRSCSGQLSLVSIQ